MNSASVARSILAQCRRYSKLTHIDASTNTPRMVDVTEKVASKRVAHAQAVVVLPEKIVADLSQTKLGSGATELQTAKGPVFATAIIAGVMAAKNTSNLIPFCHPIMLESCDIKIAFDERFNNHIVIDCFARTTQKTGIEMEALVGASSAALCVYDMMKAVSHDIQIHNVRLMSKTGGKSDFKR